MSVKFKSTEPKYYPQYNHEGDAGCDLKAKCNTSLRELITTGARMYLNERVVSQVLVSEYNEELKPYNNYNFFNTETLPEVLLNNNFTVIAPNHRVLIPTGVFIEDLTVPNNYQVNSDTTFILEAQIRPRSGMANKYGLTVLNSPGTVDAGYRNEIQVILFNSSDRCYLINDGLRIAQLVVNSVYNLGHVFDLNTEEKRDLAGYGSTGA